MKIFSYSIEIKIYILFLMATIILGILLILVKDKETREKTMADIASIIISIVSLIISLNLFYVTANLYNYQDKTLRSENTPYPYITSISAYFPTEEELQNMDIRNPINSDGNPVLTWYYFGKQEAKFFGKEIEEVGKELISNNSEEEKKLIDEIISNKESVCFSKINNHDCILFINKEIDSSFILEYGSSVINLKNYGSSCYNLELESIAVHFNETKGNKILVLNAKDTNKKIMPIVLQTNSDIKLVYCQVTHGVTDSQCIVDEEMMNELGNSVDLLVERMPDNALSYDKIEIIISCENFLNEKFRYKLILEKQGYYYISKTELLD